MKWIGLAAFLGSFTALAACHDDAPPPSGSLLADSNRDGVVDDSDRTGTDWNASGGALFLANLDDDDGDGVADATDTTVNGPDDELDLAHLRFPAWTNAGSGASATITIDGDLALTKVHLFQKRADGWTLLSLPATIDYQDLRLGLELGIEATEFATGTAAGSWDGYAVVHLSLLQGGKSVGEHLVKMRVAPFVMVNNLSALGTVWDAPLGDADAVKFGNDVMSLATKVSADKRDASTDDQWAEDWWQIGHTWMPAAGGATQGMLVTQRSAQPDRDAGQFAADQLGKDVAFIWPRTDDTGQRDDLGYSMDSFGDHDVLPPYTKGNDQYPLGRIIIGGNASHHIDPAVRSFYEAQQAQTVFQIDTTFLEVGHVDEIFSYVPAATPRGWKLLVASPTLARTLMMQWSAAGHGSATLFTGLSFYDDNGGSVPADVTIDALLADSEIMAANEQAQASIDAAKTATIAELGLTADEIVEIPFLFERIDQGGGHYSVTAHMVGTVNMRVVDGVLGIPNPHGPMIDGADALQTDLTMRLGTATNVIGADGKGLPIVWIEDWADYHTLEGEVHCGSNVMARAMANVAWWEAGR